MRVMLVSDFYSPEAGGLEAHVSRLATTLSIRGAEVMVLTAGARVGDQGTPAKIPIQRVSLRYQSIPGLYRDPSRPFSVPRVDRKFVDEIVGEIRRFKPDVIHAHGWSSISAMEAAERSSVPTVVTLHDYGLLCPMKSLVRSGGDCSLGVGFGCIRCPGSDQGTVRRVALAAFIRRNRHRNVPAAYIAVSDRVRTMHLEAGILPEAVVIPNFVDVLDAAGTPVPENGPIVFVGTEIPDKGLSVILRAFSQWEDRGSRELHVVGAIHNREPSAGVSYLGFLTGDALWDAYRSASLVVVPSTWQEPCPTVALEAMVFGRPVIGSAVGGLIEIVEHGHTGILVPPNDEAALIEAMRDLTEDAALSRLMGQNARTRVRDYSAGHVVPIIEELYVALRDSA